MMTEGERRGWRMLLELGAKQDEIFGKVSLDLRPIRLTSQKKLSLFCSAFLSAVALHRGNRRHVDQYGRPIFVVTDDWKTAREQLRRVESARKFK